MLIENEVGEFELELYHPNWLCGLTNGDESREIRLAVHVEFMDLRDSGMADEDDKRPYSVQANVVVHPDSLTEEGKQFAMTEGADRVHIADLRNNCGGVMINPNWCRASNEDWNGIDYEERDNRFYFASWDDASKFVQQILKVRLEGIMGMIGFFLDERINKIGSTGWDMIESMVYGKNFAENAFSKMAKEV